MTRLSLVQAAHTKIAEHIHPGDTVIDATLGNGHDTLFLAQQVGENGRVYGFDIQQQAIDNTQQRVTDNHLQQRCTLLLASHAEMEQQIPEEEHQSIAAIVFNLGYLPGGNKAITTHTESTLLAIDASLRLLKRGGLLNMLIYIGHPSGKQEYQAIMDWLHNHGITYEILSASDRTDAPVMVSIIKAID